MFASPYPVKRAIKNFAQRDGSGTVIAYMQDPGSAGVAKAQATASVGRALNYRHKRELVG